MEIPKILSIIFLICTQQSNGQQEGNNKKEISQILYKYSESVIERDSIKFYDLFNAGNVTGVQQLKTNPKLKKLKLKGLKAQEVTIFQELTKAFQSFI